MSQKHPGGFPEADFSQLFCNTCKNIAYKYRPTSSMTIIFFSLESENMRDLCIIAVLLLFFVSSQAKSPEVGHS